MLTFCVTVPENNIRVDIDHNSFILGYPYNIIRKPYCEHIKPNYDKILQIGFHPHFKIIRFLCWLSNRSHAVVKQQFECVIFASGHNKLLFNYLNNS